MGFLKQRTGSAAVTKVLLMVCGISSATLFQKEWRPRFCIHWDGWVFVIGEGEVNCAHL